MTLTFIISNPKKSMPIHQLILIMVTSNRAISVEQRKIIIMIKVLYVNICNYVIEYNLVLATTEKQLMLSGIEIVDNKGVKTEIIDAVVEGL